MQEIEVKILDIDRDKTEKRLLSLGAKKVFEGILHAIYYDTADHAVSKVKGTFRLRKEGERTVLAWKGHVESSVAKVREEKEVTVSDFDVMRSILSSLGYTAWLEMKKKRTTYECGGLHFEFDKYLEAYQYIPEFLEIEGKDIRTIEEYVVLLGFAAEDCRPWDAVQVADYYSALREKVL